VVKVDPTTLPNAAMCDLRPDRAPGQPDAVTVAGADVTIRTSGYREILGSISGTSARATATASATGRGRVGDHRHPDLRRAGRDLGTPDDVMHADHHRWQRNYSFPSLLPAAVPGRRDQPGKPCEPGRCGRRQPDNISVLLPVGGTVVNRDFEDMLVDIGYIGDRVWWDINGDGIQDAGEPAIPGVTVELLKNGT